MDEHEPSEAEYAYPSADAGKGSIADYISDEPPDHDPFRDYPEAGDGDEPGA